MDKGQRADVGDLAQAIDKLMKELPGWWWSVGLCNVSADASIGPCRAGPDGDLLDEKLFDDGFHADLLPPATPADALLYCLEQGKEARALHRLKSNG